MPFLNFSLTKLNVQFNINIDILYFYKQKKKPKSINLMCFILYFLKINIKEIRKSQRKKLIIILKIDRHINLAQ